MSRGDAERPEASAARVAGRGGLAITFAKVYFIVQGLLQQILLPRVIGLSGYGALASVLSAATIAYNPIVTASIQGVSRAVARTGDGSATAVRSVLRIHALLAFLSALAFFLAAGPMAALMRAPHLEPALRAASLVLGFYGLYSPFIGVLNGRRRFVAQATFDIVSATLRTAALVGCGALAARAGRGVEGAVWGVVVVTATMFVASAWVVGTGGKGPSPLSSSEHLAFLLPLFLAQVLLNLLLQADLTLLRRFAGDAAAAAGLPPTAADPLVGAYRATQLYAFLPYQLLISVTFILFPMLADAEQRGDRERVALYVTTGVRIACLVAGLLVSVTSGLSGPLLAFVYSPTVASLGAGAMQVLTLGFGAFAILGVLTAVLSSLGRERAGAAVTGAAFVLVVVSCFLRARGAPLGSEILERTAWSTATGLVLATVLAGLLVRRTAGAVVSPWTVLRTAGSLVIAVSAGRALPAGGRGMTLLAVAAVAAVYLGGLVLSRELTGRDWRTVRTVLSRGRP